MKSNGQWRSDSGLGLSQPESVLAPYTDTSPWVTVAQADGTVGYVARDVLFDLIFGGILEAVGRWPAARLWRRERD